MRKIITGIIKLVLAAVSLLFVLTLAPGNHPLAAQEGFWQARAGNAASGRVYQLNRAAMGDALSRATLETAGALSASPAVVSLPLADGRLARFRVQESPLLAPELAARFPQIKSYRGQGVDDPAATVRLGWSPRGLHALILGSEATVSIAPQDAQNPDVYRVSTGIRQDWQCDVREEQAALAGLGPIAERNLSIGGTLRVFRLAVATTQEFTNNAQLGGGSVAGAVGAINAYLNAVNAIYERELSVRLMLVSNTQIIRTAEPDGFTNDNRNTLLNEVAGMLANEVGSANYDVGHVFASGGIGGIASQGSVCNNTIGAGEAGPRKGRGVSSFSGPPVAGLGVLVHELGHQFGASHSYNGTIGTSCGPQRSTGTAWESGSGSTIMSYNGLCVSGGNTDNIGFAEETRFHNGSFTQIVNFLAGVACGTTQATGNAPPNVSAGQDYTIPRQTPFTLTATGGDPNAADAAALTYNWEQIDTGGANFAQNGTAASYTDAGDPAATTRPLFRPHPSSASPSRTFPSLNFILNSANTPPAQTNGFWTAESLPNVTRALNFRVTLRDNRGGGGGVSDDHMTVNVNGASGPFQITAPNTAVTWAAGSAQTVTWNVASTNAAPISCASVRITLSTDGGQTYPFVLSASTPNDGSQSVTLPSGIQTAQARIRVQAVGNIFFDISDVNFAINGGAGCPGVSGIAPVAGNAGTTLTLTGAGFTGVTAVRFSNNVNATINVVNDTTLMTAVPAGAVSGPLTLVKSGCPDAQTFAFLVCGSVAATLSVDDGVAESSSGSTISTFVNRLTPPSYPATLTAIQLRFDAVQSVASGTNITLLAGANADGDANIDNPSFRTQAATVGTLGQYVTYFLSAPLQITTGDFVIGFGITPTAGQFPARVDQTSPQGRSYQGDGGTFSLLASNRNLLIRGQYLTGCGSPLNCPTASGVSPGSGAPGTSVTISGTNLSAVTTVRFNNNVPASFTLDSQTQITAIVPPGATTGAITLVSPNCNNAQSPSFTVSALTCPSVSSVAPVIQQPGQTVTITGTNFNGVNVVKFNDNIAAQFTVNSNTQITATVPPGAIAGPISLSKPGCANVQSAGFTACGTGQPLFVDSGSAGSASSAFPNLTNFFVNRLSPPSYPATLTAVRIRFSTLIPIGTGMSVLAGANADGDSNINNTSFATTSGTITANTDFLTYTLAAPLTINSGDFVLGFSVPVTSGQFPAQLDAGAVQNRSYLTSSVSSFTPITTGNLMIRGVYDLSCSLPCPTVTVNPGSLPGGAISTPYSQMVSATGGASPYSFAVVAGNLPGGLGLSPGGVLSGTPNAPGVFGFTVEATDDNGCTGQREYAVVITGGGGSSGLQFFPLPGPVRLLDTRNGQLGCSAPNAPILGGTSRTQPARGFCTIPMNAAAITGHVTSVQSSGGFLTLYPGDAALPLVASNNYAPNEIVNNVFTVGLGAAGPDAGTFKIFAQNTTEVVVDVTGYYAPPTSGGLYFHPLPKPIRLLETRPGQVGCFAPGAQLPGNSDTPQQAHGVCDGVTIPATARAIAGNATTVSPQGLGFLTLFPGNAVRPLAASSNFDAGQAVNGPFTVGLAPNGVFNIFTSVTTHLVVDVLGYYSDEASDVNGAGLLFNPLAKPVRLLDTRAGQIACFAPGAPIPANTDVSQLARGTCQGESIPASALAVLGNATVINPQGGFLTLWPGNASRPLAATSNFNAGQIVNRHFAVGLGPVSGAFNLYAQLQTDLVIDLSGYFAP